MDSKQILSVGIDIGTSTSQLVFSRLELRNRAAACQIPRFEITDRRILWQSPVAFTPLTDVDTLDEAALDALIRGWYAEAGVRPEDVETGAVIVTGESLKTVNARRTVMRLADSLGDFVVASAGPHLESVIAGRGAGAAALSEARRGTVLNIDIGGGRTNVSVFSFGHQIVWDILNVGGDRFDDAIIDYLRKKHNLLIGARTAEELKIDIGSARMRGVKLEMDACGRSLVSGLPRAVTVSSEEMIEALDEPLRDLMSALHRMIERTPPELASDIFDEGITLSGGGAQLFGLDGVISDQLKIRTTLADEPDLCVAHGLSELIDDEERYENIDLVSGSRSDLLGDD